MIPRRLRRRDFITTNAVGQSQEPITTKSIMDAADMLRGIDRPKTVDVLIMLDSTLETFRLKFGKDNSQSSVLSEMCGIPIESFPTFEECVKRMSDLALIGKRTMICLDKQQANESH